ncbi:MAG: phosphoribosyl-AMP cyclohydrolase, partial [Pseudomonadales bacterium]
MHPEITITTPEHSPSDFSYAEINVSKLLQTGDLRRALDDIATNEDRDSPGISAWELVSMEIDCDGDTLLVSATPSGPTCHLGTSSC